MPDPLKAPFPYFGSKSTVAHVVWQRFGNVPNYCESFFGSGAVLLSRPHEPGIETITDADGFLSNFWRSVQHDPDAVAYHADYPAIESDLHARHAWLVQQTGSLTDRLEGNPHYYDAKIAGWWCWGMSLWIGREFCSGNGPYVQKNGKLVKKQCTEQGISKQIPRLSVSGQGIYKTRIHLGNAGTGVHKTTAEYGIHDWMNQLSNRLRRVRVCCGDWKRILGPSPTTHNGLTGVFLDPPYGNLGNRDNNLYRIESDSVAYECQQWCIENGSNKLLRIALCGYVGEHDILQDHGWTAYHWKSQGGMGNTGSGKGKENRHKEVIWFSPHCLTDAQMSMF